LNAGLAYVDRDDFAHGADSRRKDGGQIIQTRVGVMSICFSCQSPTVHEAA